MSLTFSNAQLIRGAILLATALSLLSCSTGRAQIRIENIGGSMLKGVVVRVRGISHSLGDLAADDSKTVIVEPGQESTLEIDLANEKGESKKLKTDFMLENGYKGFILVRIKDGAIAHAEKDY